MTEELQQESTEDFTRLMVTATDEVRDAPVNLDAPTPNTRLPSLWHMRTQKLEEYRKDKTPDTLKLVNELTKEAKEYVRKRNRENWFSLCESFD